MFTTEGEIVGFLDGEVEGDEVLGLGEGFWLGELDTGALDGKGVGIKLGTSVGKIVGW